MVYNLGFFPLQNAVCFINLTYLVPVLFTFNIQGVLFTSPYCVKVSASARFVVANAVSSKI